MGHEPVDSGNRHVPDVAAPEAAGRGQPLRVAAWVRLQLPQELEAGARADGAPLDRHRGHSLLVDLQPEVGGRSDVAARWAEADPPYLPAPVALLDAAELGPAIDEVGALPALVPVEVVVPGPLDTST